MTHDLTPPSAPPEDDDFIVVSNGEVPEPETKLLVDEIGDQFTGKYLGTRRLDNDQGGYTQMRFEINGEVYFINANYSLRTGMANVTKGSRVRITYMADADTGQMTPMRVFQVEVAGRRNAVIKTAVTNVKPSVVTGAKPKTKPEAAPF
jgi:hypothetical protein